MGGGGSTIKSKNLIQIFLYESKQLIFNQLIKLFVVYNSNESFINKKKFELKKQLS